MKFLFYRFGSVCEPDMMEGFLALGHEVDTIDTEITWKDVPGEKIVEIVSSALSSGNYDAVVSVNYYPIVSEVCRIFGVRYIAWTVDSPVIELLSDTVANNTNRIFCFDYKQYGDLSPYNPGGVFYLPLATNPGRWDKVIAGASAGEHEKFRNDISFVGSLYTEKCPYDALGDVSAYTRGFLEGMMESQKKVYGYFFLNEVLTDEVISDFIRNMPDYYIPPEKARRDDAMEIALKYLGMKVTCLERLEVMKLLGEKYNVTAYTGSDTTKLPVRNGGRVKTLTEMPLVFHNSRINLNISCRSIRTGISQRTWDIMGAGGFVLTNYQEEIANFFEPGRDIEVYGSMEELLDKTAYYLEHEDVRARIARSGSKKVHEGHSYKDRIGLMIELAFE